MLFFLVFLISPGLAQKYWILLVIYTEVVILFQYFWQFPVTDGVPSDNLLVILFGIKYFDNFWQGLAFHLGILLSAWLQLRTYRFLETKALENLVPYTAEADEEWGGITDLGNDSVASFLGTTKKIFESLYHDYLITWIFFVLMLSIFLDSIDLMDVS